MIEKARHVKRNRSNNIYLDILDHGLANIPGPLTLHLQSTL